MRSLRNDKNLPTIKFALATFYCHGVPQKESVFGGFSSVLRSSPPQKRKIIFIVVSPSLIYGVKRKEGCGRSRSRSISTTFCCTQIFEHPHGSGTSRQKFPGLPRNKVCFSGVPREGTNFSTPNPPTPPTQGGLRTQMKVNLCALSSCLIDTEDGTPQSRPHACLDCKARRRGAEQHASSLRQASPLYVNTSNDGGCLGHLLRFTPLK